MLYQCVKGAFFTAVQQAISSCLCLTLLVIAGCSDSTPTDSSGGETKPDQGASSLVSPAAAPNRGKPRTSGELLDDAGEILNAMAEAYRNCKSYADAGKVRMMATSMDDEKIDETANFSISLSRPNRLHLEVYRTGVVCDGQQFFAVNLQHLPNQVMVRPAPTDFPMRWFSIDPLLDGSLQQGFAGAPPQWVLLTAKDALAILLPRSENIVLREPGLIEGSPCYCVEVTRPDGKIVFWIDQETFVLRRLVYPTDSYQQEMARLGKQVRSASLVADFEGAQFNKPIPPEAFQFEIPPEANQTKFFVFPDPGQLLGKKIGEFEFSDYAGNRLTRQSLAGKIVVFDFWETGNEPCKQSLQLLNEVYEKYRDDGRIVFYAASTDRPTTDNAMLQAMFRQWNVALPGLRDPGGFARRAFNVAVIPSTIILDGKGVVQDFELGVNQELTVSLPAKLERLLAGQSIYEEPLAQYEVRERAFLQQREADAARMEESSFEEQPIPQAEILPRSDPKTVRLSQLWRFAELKAPGNVIAVPEPNGNSRIFVTEGYKSVVEFDVEGRVAARHALDIEQTELISALRTGVGADGKRYYVAFGMGFARPQFHLFDENWKRLWSFPKDAADEPNSRIADVQFEDIDGDGILEAIVGHWDIVGVQVVSLDGKLRWMNSSLANVPRIAFSSPDANGRRSIICSNEMGTLAVINADQQRLPDIVIPNRMLHWIGSADLHGNGQPSWCGLGSESAGSDVALGINARGEVLWTYPMPFGIHERPIERVVPGQVRTSGPGQWIIPGADGSIHIINADGKLLDRFNYGAALGGIATATKDGRPLLVVASANGVEALAVE